MNTIIYLVCGYIGYIICGFLWSLIEWYMLLRSSRKRAKNSAKNIPLKNFIPDGVTANKLMLSSMVAWPVRIVQFLIYELTQRIFAKLYHLTVNLYSKMAGKMFENVERK